MRIGRKKIDLQQFLATLDDVYGNIEACAVALGISPATVYRWLKKDPKFRQQVYEVKAIARERLLDVCESNIIKAVSDGNLRACEFILRTLGKGRGYSESYEIKPSLGIDTTLSEEELTELVKKTLGIKEDTKTKTLPAVLSIDFLRQRIQKDVNIFIETIFKDEKGHPLKQQPFHLELQNFFDTHKNGIVMLPREHGKTTQMIARIIWEMILNPDIRIKVICSSSELAIARGRAIAQLLTSPLLISLFPHLGPGREWQESRLTIQRNVILPDPTLELFGIDSLDVGGRADLIFADDIDDEDVRFSRALRERNFQRLCDVWLNLLSPSGRFYLLCTPWHPEDCGNRLKREFNYPIFFRKTSPENPLWPERWNAEKLEEKKALIGARAFARGFLLELISSEEQLLDKNKLKFFPEHPPLRRIIISIDPAISENPLSDWTVIMTIGTDEENYYLLDIIREHLSFAQTREKVILCAERIYEKFKLHPSIIVENSGYQKALADALKEQTYLRVIPFTPRGTKTLRAERASIILDAGKIYLPQGDSRFQPLLQEMDEFPEGEHDDTIDALSQGIIWLEENASRPKIRIIQGGG